MPDRPRGSLNLLGDFASAPRAIWRDLLGDRPSVAQQMQGLDTAQRAALAQGGVRGLMQDPALAQQASDVASNFNFVGKTGDPRASVIKDWRWLPEGEVKAKVGVTAVPPHVQDFGGYMGEMAGKAKAGSLSARDLVKAFTITRSSIQRSALTADKVRERWPDFPGGGDKVRPEGAFSEWLLTPTGRRYLDAAERGEFDAEAAGDAVAKLGGFGKGNDLHAALLDATRLPGQEAKVGGMIAQAFDKPGKGIEEWRAWTKSLPGIGPAKSGFVGSMLGRGDQPTLDARQLLLQTGKPTAEAQPYLRRGSGRGAYQAVDRLAERQQRMGLEMPAELEPFRQHLTHHTLWDAYGKEKTTHADLIKAMRLAGLAPPALIAGGLLGEEQRQ